MNPLHDEKMKGFYLDIARYTFNYLFDLGVFSLSVRCTSQDAKEFKKIFHADELKLSNKEEHYISIILKEDNFSFIEIDECNAISYEEFIACLYRYARKEDDSISLLTQKRLFKESLDYGFSNLRSEQIILLILFDDFHILKELD